MTWLVWRQNRSVVLWLGVAFGVMAVFVLVTGLAMRGFEGGIGCLSANAAHSCGGQGDFRRQFDPLLSLNGWFNLIPGVVGIFLGAPLLAREFEHGTHRLAWTQAISRTRWLGGQLAGALVIAAVAGVVLLVGMTWWRAPWDTIDSRFDPLGYDFEGLMPIGTLVLATTLGVAAGAVLRRTLAAMAATLGAFLLIRLPVEFWIRAHLMTPLTVSAVGKSAPSGAWVLDSGLTDAAGNHVSSVALPADCTPTTAPLDCLSAHGIRDVITYQPADRFWTFQVIEFGIYLSIAISCVVLTVWWVRRRAR